MSTQQPDLEDPLVTIAIPNYNYAHYLSETISSVLNQTFKNFELLISDNCSSDNSIEVIKQYNDPRIKWWKNETNVGVYPNWDLLYKKAKGKYFKLLQADDWLHKDFLKETIELLEATNADVAFAGFGYRGSENKDTLPSAIGLTKTGKVLNQQDIVNYFDQPLGSFIHPTTSIIRKNLIPEGYGGTNKNFFMDMVFWAKAITFGKVVVVDKILSYQRMHTLQDRNTRRDKSISIIEITTALNILKALPGISIKIKRFKYHASGEAFFQMILAATRLDKTAIRYFIGLKESRCLLSGMTYSLLVFINRLRWKNH